MRTVVRVTGGPCRPAKPPMFMSTFNQEPTVNLSLPQATDPKAASRCPCLRMLTGSSAGRLYRFTGQEMTIGRAPDNDIVVETTGVSRVHARLTKAADGAVMLVDLGSTNGTFVEGEPVATRVLRDGDQIGLATQALLRFSVLSILEEQAEEQLYPAGALDELTGALNRKTFLERLSRAYAAAQARGVELVLARINADQYRRTLEQSGQLAADAVLIELGRRFREGLETGEWLGRLVAEEFAILLPGCAPEKAEERFEKLRREVAATRVRVPGSQELEITVSVGIVSVRPEPGSAWDTLAKRADAALFEAQEGGGNRVVRHKSLPPKLSLPGPLDLQPIPPPAVPPAPASSGAATPPPKSIPAPRPGSGSAGKGEGSSTWLLEPRVNASPPPEGAPGGPQKSPVFLRPRAGLKKPPPEAPVGLSLSESGNLRLPQRRKQPRVACQFNVNCLATDRASFAGTVREMSMSGLRLELPRPVEAGALLALVPGKTALAVTVKVVWCRESPRTRSYHVGALFQVGQSVLDTSWVRQAWQSMGLLNLPREERRSQARVAAVYSVSLTLANGQTLQGRTINLGSHGCLLECANRLDPGQQLKLNLLRDGKSMSGPAWVLRSRQVDGGRWVCGLMFETWEASDNAALINLLRELLRCP